RSILKPGGNLIRLRFSRMASAFLPVCGTGGMLGSTPDTFICLRFSIFVCWADAAAIGSASTNEEANSPIRNGLEACICILLDELKEPTGPFAGRLPCGGLLIFLVAETPRALPE